MKKLMFIALAALCAVVTKANTVEWSTGTLYDKNGDIVAEGATGYTATLYVFTDAAMTTPVELTGNSSSVVDDCNTINGVTGDSAALTGGTYYGYMEIINGGDTLKSMGFSFEVSDMLGAGLVYVGDGGDGIAPISGSFDDENGAWGPAGSNWSSGSGGGVPEPTSGILLVLGGAMLALRRRRA